MAEVTNHDIREVLDLLKKNMAAQERQAVALEHLTEILKQVSHITDGKNEPFISAKVSGVVYNSA